MGKLMFVKECMANNCRVSNCVVSLHISAGVRLTSNLSLRASVKGFRQIGQSMKTFRILIADDHEIVRRGLRTLLQSHEGWEICGEAVDGGDAVEKVARLKPDLAILDIRMPKLNGLEATRQILQQEPRIAVLVLTIDESEHVFREALKSGAKGFLGKSDAARSLNAGVEALQR